MSYSVTASDMKVLGRTCQEFFGIKYSVKKTPLALGLNISVDLKEYKETNLEVLLNETES